MLLKSFGLHYHCDDLIISTNYLRVFAPRQDLDGSFQLLFHSLSGGGFSGFLVN